MIKVFFHHFFLAQSLPGGGNMMTLHKFFQRVMIIQSICFIAILCFIWINEFFNLTAFFTPGEHIEMKLEFGEGIILSAFIVIAAIVVMLTTYNTFKLFPADHHVVMTKTSVCSVCRKVKHNGRWIPFDDYVSKDTSSKLKHSLCPDCMDTYYHGVTDTAAINYKELLREHNSRKNVHPDS